MNFSNEQIAKAKAAKSVEEFLTLAKENGMELTEEEATKYFAELHKEGELPDEALEAITGGKDYEFFDLSHTVGVWYDPNIGRWLCPNCEHTLSYCESDSADSGTFDVYKCDSCGKRYYYITSGKYYLQWRQD